MFYLWQSNTVREGKFSCESRNAKYSPQCHTAAITAAPGDGPRQWDDSLWCRGGWSIWTLISFLCSMDSLLTCLHSNIVYRLLNRGVQVPDWIWLHLVFRSDDLKALNRKLFLFCLLSAKIIADLQMNSVFQCNIRWFYSPCWLFFFSPQFSDAALLSTKTLTQKRTEVTLTTQRESTWDVGKEFCYSQSVCLPRPRPLSPRAVCPPATVISWLSGGKESAKQGTVYLCRLCSLHIPAVGLRHHSNLPRSAKKRPADVLPTTVCTAETEGHRSLDRCVPVLSAADPTN